MLKSSLCDYSDAYTLVKGAISVVNTLVKDGVANNVNIKVIFKNSAPFTDSINEINKAQVDNANDRCLVMLMYN